MKIVRVILKHMHSDVYDKCNTPTEPLANHDISQFFKHLQKVYTNRTHTVQVKIYKLVDINLLKPSGNFTYDQV
jgi:hypothetical protein